MTWKELWALPPGLYVDVCHPSAGLELFDPHALPQYSDGWRQFQNPADDARASLSALDTGLCRSAATAAAIAKVVACVQRG